MLLCNCVSLFDVVSPTLPLVVYFVCRALRCSPCMKYEINIKSLIKCIIMTIINHDYSAPTPHLHSHEIVYPHEMHAPKNACPVLFPIVFIGIAALCVFPWFHFMLSISYFPAFYPDYWAWFASVSWRFRIFSDTHARQCSTHTNSVVSLLFLFFFFLK